MKSPATLFIPTALARHHLTFSLLPLLLAVTLPAKAADENPPVPAATRDGQHDFDFEIGTWKTSAKCRLNPLTGSAAWIDYEGTTVVRKVWDGRANLLELEANGLPGHFELLTLRLYNPSSRQWSLSSANGRAGAMQPPVTGEFQPEEGRALFHGQEVVNGRVVLVRFAFSDIRADSYQFERFFSEDGGRTWELNWVATDTRVNEDSTKPQ